LDNLAEFESMTSTLDNLEEEFSRPNDNDLALMRRLDGDILILGAGGKMGRSMARMARRAADQSATRRRIFAASRFSSEDARWQLEACGVETIPCDLLDREQYARLPDCPNVLFLTGRKFGSLDNQPLTWATNVLLPGFVGERFRGSRIVVLSSGNVYPLSAQPATESTPPAPIGEYAQSVLGRERTFEYYSVRDSTPVAFIRSTMRSTYGTASSSTSAVVFGRGSPFRSRWAL
jgi:nucleoside-diphosphate-sugar epimerase